LATVKKIVRQLPEEKAREIAKSLLLKKMSIEFIIDVIGLSKKKFARPAKTWPSAGIKFSRMKFSAT